MSDYELAGLLDAYHAGTIDIDGIQLLREEGYEIPLTTAEIQEKE